MGCTSLDAALIVIGTYRNGAVNMKTLAELAEEYLQQAEELKNKINQLPEDTEDYALRHKRCIYEDMHNEAMTIYYRLRNYYGK